MKDLDQAIRDLKNNKSRDNEGLINEIFKHAVIGDDLKKIVVDYVQQIEKEQVNTSIHELPKYYNCPKEGFND